MRNNEPIYEKVALSEDSTTIGEEDAQELRRQNLRSTQNRRLKHLLIANVLILCTSVILLSITFIRNTPSTAQFVRKYSSWSPAVEAVEYISGTFNATQGMASGYVGTSNLTDEMWDLVTGDIGDQMITPEEMKFIDKPLTSVKVKHPKTGKEGYRIGLEVFHQLHCLNLIRKDTYREHYDGKGDFAEKDKGKLRDHINHCLEMLRMNIMCQVDIGVITFHERPDRPGDPYPDFSSKHVCRNFDEVRDWAINNTVANDDIF